MEKEIWLPIKGYEGLYEVSNLGRVKSFYQYKGTDNRILIQKDNENGYHYFIVSIYKNKKSMHVYIHRLVAQAFIPNPENKKEVNHIDNDTSNNNVSNLEWVTPKENSYHKNKQGRGATGEKHGRRKLSKKDVIKIRNSNLKQQQLADLYNISRPNISLIKNNKIWIF